MIESYNPAAESKDTDDSSSGPKREGFEIRKDTKRSADRRKIGTFTAKNTLEAPNIHRVVLERPSLARELMGEKSEKQKERKTGNEDDAEDEKDKDLGKNTEKDDAQPETDLGNFEGNEEQEVALRLAEARAAEVLKQSEEQEEGRPKTSVEDAATIAFTESVRQKVSDNPEVPVEQMLDEAAAETIELIGTGNDSAEDEPSEASPSGDNAEDSYPTEGEIPLHSEAVEDEGASTIVIPRGGAGGGGTGMPPSGGTGSGGVSGPSGGSGGGGGGGGVPPRTPGPGGPGMPPAGGPSRPGFPGPNFNVAPSPAGTGSVSVEDLNRIVHRQERAAIAQGLLIGGIIGYLIGRRRGRIKTEKRLLPIQKKLEKQVESLQTAMLEKETKVRQAAAERARQMATQQERDRFAQKLARDEAIRAKTAERRRKSEVPAVHPERLGRMLVEAPAVILTGSAAARRADGGIETPKATLMPDKKVEDYTTVELKQAAAKVRIDGTSLKELWDRGQLNERAVERIMTEYIEGHSVRTALNKELFEEDVRFELDPKLRDDSKGRLGGGGGGPADAPIAAKAGAAMLLRSLGGNAVDKRAETSISQPSTFQQIHQHPEARLAAAGAVILGLIILAVFLIF